MVDSSIKDSHAGYDHALRPTRYTKERLSLISALDGDQCLILRHKTQDLMLYEIELISLISSIVIMVLII